MVYNPFSLEGKTILVTGASSGIGQASLLSAQRWELKLLLVVVIEAFE